MSDILKAEQVTLFNRGHSAKIFKNIVRTGEPVVVTQNNNALVVILPAEKYVELTGKGIHIELKPASKT